MLRRVLSLLLAFAVAGAPAAVEACGVACASTMARAASHHVTHEAGHACHDDAANQRPQLSQAPHTCDHGGHLPSTPTLGTGQDINGAFPLGLIATSTAIVASSRTPAFWTALAVRAPHPAGLQLAVPLRI